MVCRIDEPVVTQPSTNYGAVTFHTGDRITVDAGGCVQTGGHGATWKRYVNPSGPNSNRLYSGTITIPGATPGEVRISDVLGQTLTVAPGVRQADLFLRLGYIDDDYGDNGYDSHDDGTENQCKNIGNAFVTLTIEHAGGTANTCAGSTGNKPLDLVWTECDPNGFPFNPQWRDSVEHSGRVPVDPPTLCGHPNDSQYGGCTSWPLKYDHARLCDNPPYSFFEERPHVNWFAATFQGLVDWEEKSTEFTDDDYNFRLFPPHNEGVVRHPDTTVNGLEFEFDSDETIDHFVNPLWNSFHQLVHDNNSQAQAQVHRRTTVVTGLFGLDCGHPSCSSELHPVYAMAVNMDNSDLNNDTWLVFARNWGNEGFCSSEKHDLPVTSLKVMIPWQAGATDVTVLPDTQFSTFVNSDSDAPAAPGPPFTKAVGQGLQMEFNLPDPSAQVGQNGEVHLKWTMPQSARESLIRQNAAARVGSVARRQTANPETGSSEADKPERRTEELISKMSAAQLQVFRSRMQAHSPRVRATGVARAGLNATRPAGRVTQVAKLPPPPQGARLISPTSAPDPRLTQRTEAVRLSLCEAYKNNVPGAPQFCSTTPAKR